MIAQSALYRLRLSRQALLQAITGLDEAALTGPKVEGIWTMKDLLGHITAWELACLEPLERFSRSDSFRCEDIPDHDAWNALQAAIRQKTEIPVVVAEMKAVRRRLEAAAAACSPAQWAQTLHLPWGEQANLAGMLNGLAWHEEEHLKSIAAWRSR
jgi:hypothetical protein